LAKHKLQRFAENATFPHFFQEEYYSLQSGFSLLGRWNRDFFRNSNPIIIELGCGKGEYTVNLARKYPGRNYIGFDKKGARMWRGAKTSLENNLPNVAFVRTQIELITEFFTKGEVSEIWITFPEPQPNSPRIRKRFTSPQFIERYRKILKPGGIIHLKTDSDLIYNYTLEVIEEGSHQLLFATNDLYREPGKAEVTDVVSVQTHYEQIWLSQGAKIKYLRFRLNDPITYA
jgi:tRNA (guanine-N7-)-methyltransferase